MTTRRQPEPLAELAGDALRELARGLWQWRLELLVLAVLAGAWWLLQHALSPIAAAAAIVLLALAAGISASLRFPAALRPFHAARVRRALLGALSPVQGAHSVDSAILRVRSVRRVPAGDVVRVRMARGHTVAELEHQAELISANVRLHDCRVTRDRADASRATVLLMRRDPFDSADPLPWPPIAQHTENQTGVEAHLSPSEHPARPAAPPETSLWSPIPVGVNELGEPVTLALPERNVLIAGEPGAGKSATLQLLIAAAALDPRAGVWLIDGKGGVELTAWAPIARQIAFTRDDSMHLLADVHAGMERRLAELVARGLRKLTPGAGLQLLVVDELAAFTATGSKQADDDFSVLLRDVVQRGRAAGVITIVATQKPASDVVPSALRDLFGFRLAMRCSTRDASDTILGRGYASAGYDASSIPGRQRGVGYLLAEADRPARIRTYYLDDDHVAGLVERATSVRLDTEERPGERPIAA